MRWSLLLISVLWTTLLVPEKKFTFQEKPVLTWDDFMGTPPVDAHHAASVNSGIAYGYSAKRTRDQVTIEFDVRSEFYPQLSWKKDLLEDDAQLLRHEQLHWNISELHARILKRAFDNYNPTQNYKVEILGIFKRVESNRQTMQARYDKETNHGLILSKQREWETYISQEFFKTS
ncbi:DUF922 domain-containing protein [Nonlabens ulvanivorans]|uniref:DUF922 domain-containing protein n=1 Tax=Nonlabens ulvanivorans TaxID=906888 RepID=A0A090QHX5_NONUL|nr:DUF922 domain-containing protein [Nonlabens ulvanivorans]WOI24058.1 DUF922 domain-containing protein [Nonlabens ulvanivorans]GAL01853.1 hypothetical protein JCM19314_2207 [Nonlabens ulvanivorans]